MKLYKTAAVLMALTTLFAAAPTAQADIIGADERHRVNFPAVCKVYSYFHNASQPGVASGVLIGRRYLLTAAHVVYNPDNPDSTAYRVIAIPGQQGLERPFGEVRCDNPNNICIPTYYKALRSAGHVGQWQYDLAVIRLDEPIGDTVGWLPVADVKVISQIPISAPAVTVAGYPSDVQDGIFQLACLPFKELFTTANKVFYAADTEGGMSGSPVLGVRQRLVSMRVNGKPTLKIKTETYVVGVHNHGTGIAPYPDLNGGTRLNAEKLRFIRDAIAALGG